MPRIERINTGDLIYHVLNRSNARVPIFEQRNIPFGSDVWVDAIINNYDIEQTRRPRGRPKKGG